MSPDDRLALARQTTVEKRERLVASAAPACVDCVHSSYKNVPGEIAQMQCGHVAASDFKFDHVEGRLADNRPPARDVRARNGLCGPEGSLYEAKRVPMVWRVRMATGAVLAAMVAAAAAISTQ